VATKTAAICHWTGYCASDEIKLVTKMSYMRPPGISRGVGGGCEVSDDVFDMLSDRENYRKVLSDGRNERYSKIF
jgi:hypothetical protein